MVAALFMFSVKLGRFYKSPTGKTNQVRLKKSSINKKLIAVNCGSDLLVVIVE